MFTKFVFVFLVTLSVSDAKLTLPQELQEFVDDLHNLCIKKSGITEDDHKAYDIKDSDPKMTCYMKCLMHEAKWMSSDGVIQYDFIVESAHPEVKDLLVAALNKCRNINDGADQCEKAYNFNVCMFQADPENWFFV